MSRALGRPAAANCPASSFCDEASSVTANRAAGSDGRLSTSAGYESAISDTTTMGGSRETGMNALTVVPMSSRSSAIVSSVTPAAQAESAEERSLPAADINGPFNVS